MRHSKSESRRGAGAIEKDALKYIIHGGKTPKLRDGGIRKQVDNTMVAPSVLRKSPSRHTRRELTRAMRLLVDVPAFLPHVLSNGSPPLSPHWEREKRSKRGQGGGYGG